jgi:NADH-quinone oxidoreductase subunit M
MMLLVFLLIPLVGGLLAWLVGRASPLASRWISLVALAAGLVMTLAQWFGGGATPTGGRWLLELRLSWIPQFGITFHLALDGLSLLMLALTFFLGVASVLVSWTEITERVGFFHFNLLLVLAGVAGVFLAVDLFLFYFFWELMLVPMYFLIAIWGHERRTYAAIKFFIFTQAGGLFMLLAILGLVFAHGRATGTLTFDYEALLGTALSPAVATWLMIGFLAAFLIKLPAVPVHTWLPDAHTQAPTAGSVVLAGLLLKTGAYGLLRFAVPLFPDASLHAAPILMALGVAGILYGASLAFSQTDLKRMVAYTSVSHLGFVLLGVYTWNELALQGVVMQMIAHGLSTGALFMVVGLLAERTHTRDMREMGGLWAAAPRIGSVALFFALASLGLPGMGNFVAEFLVLIGSWQAQMVITILGTTGLVAATIYALWLVQRAFQGENTHHWSISDLNPRETGVMVAVAMVLVWLGLYPHPVLAVAKPALDALRGTVSTVAMLAGR